MFKLFAKKPKPAPKPEVECPVKLGQKIDLGRDLRLEIHEIGKKEEGYNIWSASGKLFVRLPTNARTPHVEPVNIDEDPSLVYFIIYNLPSGDAGVIKVPDTQWKQTSTDNYGRKLSVYLNFTKIETE